jgi:hypothetical protein
VRQLGGMRAPFCSFAERQAAIEGEMMRRLPGGSTIATVGAVG